MGRYSALLLLSLLVTASSKAVASKEHNKTPADDVFLLTTDEFAEKIEQQPSPALVKFMTADCKVCMELVPDYSKVATNLKGIATVAAVDCGHHRSVRTCRAFGVYGNELPKIVVFKPGSKINPYTGGALKEFDQYKGKLTARALVTAVTDQLNEQHITHISNSKDHKEFLKEDANLAKVLLFTDKNVTTVLYKGLSWAYPGRLLFAEVRKSEDTAPLLEEYGVTEFPTLLVAKPDGNLEHYTGPLKAPPLREFLDGHAAKQPQPKGEPGQTTFEKMLEVQLHSLDAAKMTDIDASEDMWLLAFHRAQDGACSSQLEKFTALLQEVQGVVNFGSINTASAGIDDQKLKQFGVDLAALDSDGCALQLVLLLYGRNKAEKEDVVKYKGSLDDAKALQSWILQKVPDFTALLDDSLEAQAFTQATAADLPDGAIKSAEDRKAPVAKVFLFSTKDEVPGIYKALALQFHGKSRLLFGWTKQSDTDGPHFALMQKMNVRKAPAMAILLPLPPKPVGDPSMLDEPTKPRPEGEMAIQQYMGPLKFQKMSAWLKAMSMLAGLSYQRHAGATEVPTANDLDIHNQAHLQEACYDKPSLCLLVLLDGTSDLANKYRDMTKKVAAALHGQPLTWVAVDVSRQHSFRRAYGFERDQLPALVALSTRRMRFAQGAAPFSEASAKQLVTKVLAGSAVTLPLPALPSLVDGGEPDEELSAVTDEEEFNLQEIMAEEINAVLSKEQQLLQAEREIEEQEKAKQAKKKNKSRKKSKKKSTKKKTKKSSPAAAKDEL